MNRQELQELLNTLLLGNSAYNIYAVGTHVGNKLAEWFDDTQGYYSTRVNAYTITICYKGRGVVSFDIKRQRDETHGYIVKQVVIESDFTDTETRVKEIKERLRKENREDWRYKFATNTLEQCTDFLRVIKEHYPSMNDKQIRDMLDDLRNYYWHVEENLNGGK